VRYKTISFVVPTQKCYVYTFRHALSNATKKKHRNNVRQMAPELNLLDVCRIVHRNIVLQ